MQWRINLFLFNAKTDYLPYYKTVTIDLSPSQTTRDLIERIARKNEFFAYPTDKPLLFRLNDVVCTGEESLEAVAKRLGTSLTLTPVQPYRSNHCLVIDDSDFYEAYETLSPYCDKADEGYFKSLYALHYASETFNYDKSYKGDALIALAARLVRCDNPHEREILARIKETLDRCEYENNLFEPYDLQPDIDLLRAKLYPPRKPSLLDKLKAKMPVNRKPIVFDAIDITDKKTAIFGETDATLTTTLVTFFKSRKKSGRTIYETAPELALKKAGSILLDAFDRGAEVLVCTDIEDARFFVRKHREIERAVGREIPLRITTLDALIHESIRRAA